MPWNRGSRSDGHCSRRGSSDEAAEELDVAFEHYRAIHRDLAGDLITQFRRGIDRILTHPNAWQAMDETYRRYRVNRFPYGMVYRIDIESDTIVVVAVMHLSQEPNYWRGRDC